jgi:hypothetical protein
LVASGISWTAVPEQVLINHAPEIYSPFASAEVGRLREYVETVDSLVGMKAITETWSWKIEIVPDGNGASEQMDYVGEEALHDAAGRFRLLYDHKEGMSLTPCELCSTSTWPITNLRSKSRRLPSSRSSAR